MRYIQLIFVFLFITNTGFGQLQKAEKAFDNLEFHDAINFYISYLENNDDDLDSRAKLAQCYSYTNQFREAEANYAQLISIFKEKPKLQLNYANILLINGKVSEAKYNVMVFLDSRPNHTRGMLLLNSCNRFDELMSTEHKYIISSPDFSPYGSHFSPVYYGNKLVFTSENSATVDNWTGRPFMSIFETNESLDEANVVIGNINGKYHNGAVCFTDDDETMYFTRNSKKKNKNNTLTLILAKATKEKKGWKFEEFFDHNAKEYSTAYPTISQDGKYMIFSSDRPGGEGGMDLYYSKLNNGEWSEPRNLGSSINTERDEVFPFIDNKGELYFASDGYPGLGGLDIFRCTGALDDWNTPSNIGSPINSSKDDFGLITKDEMKTGYFSTNRNSHEGLDKIVQFEKTKEILTMKGIVLDKYTKIPLPQVELTLTNTSTGEKQYFSTRENGRFSFEVPQDAAFEIEGVKNGIKTTKETVSTYDKTSEDRIYIELLHNDPRFTLNGVAHNLKTKIGIPDVHVTLFNLDTSDEYTDESDEKGDFHFQLEQDTEYQVSGMRNGFYTTTSEATTKGLDRTTTLYAKLFLSIEEVIIGETKIIGKEKIGGWDFDPIYYDLDKDFIRQDAADVLDKILEFLLANPNLRIEMGSHTDARSSDSYNMDLSSRRAKSAMNYLINKGIEKGRVTYRGYGESRLTNHCKDGVECSEDQHQMNRRTEMKILE